MDPTTLSLREAIGIVEGYRTHDPLLEEAQKFFEKGLQEETNEDYEKRGEYYFYLLRILCKKQILLDNPMAQNYYLRMTESFEKQTEKFQAEVALPKDVRQMQMHRTQLKAFYKLIERYFSALEKEFHDAGFIDFRDKAYGEKMKARTRRYKVEGNWSSYFMYSFFDLTCKFGLSFVRWGMTAASLILLFAVMYFISDFWSPTKIIYFTQGFSFDYVYFSMGNFTSLGMGDFLPHSTLQKALVMGEVFTGYTMLGMFITILGKRL